MKTWLEYELPISGLGVGIHQYHYDIPAKFFASFSDSPIKEGEFEVNLIVDKKPEGMILAFTCKGYMKSECDRCMEVIPVKIKSEQSFVYRYNDEIKEEDDVIYIVRNTPTINVAPMIHESICLGIPIKKLYDCENDPKPKCNQEVLKYLVNQELPLKESESSVWDVLKNIKS